MVTTVCENYSNNAITTLNGAITDVAVSLVVDDPTNFPSTGDFRICVEGEVMIVTGVTGSTFTVIRGAESTTGAAHADQITVAHVLTAGGFLRGVCQEILHGGCVYAASSGGTDTYAITVAFDPDVAQDPCQLTEGMQVYFKADVANTDAATLNLNGLGAVSIKKDVTDDLETGDIEASMIVHVVYDGTNWQMIQGISYSALFVSVCRATRETDNCYYDVAGGTGNAMTASVTPIVTSYFSGLQMLICTPGDSGEAPTLNVDGVGADTIYRGLTELEPNDYVQGEVIHVVHDGLLGWQMVGRDPCSPNQMLGDRTAVALTAGCLYDPVGTVVIAAGKATVTVDLIPSPPIVGADFTDGTHVYFRLSASLTGTELGVGKGTHLNLNGNGVKEIFQTGQSQLSAPDGKQSDIWHCVYDRPNSKWFKVG